MHIILPHPHNIFAGVFVPSTYHMLKSPQREMALIALLIGIAIVSGDIRHESTPTGKPEIKKKNHPRRFRNALLPTRPKAEHPATHRLLPRLPSNGERIQDRRI
jgi:hypothetical protein